jgi:hypothetical protein
LQRDVANSCDSQLLCSSSIIEQPSCSVLTDLYNGRG